MYYMTYWTMLLFYFRWEHIACFYCPVINAICTRCPLLHVLSCTLAPAGFRLYLLGWCTAWHPATISLSACSQVTNLFRKASSIAARFIKAPISSENCWKRFWNFRVTITYSRRDIDWKWRVSPLLRQRYHSLILVFRNFLSNYLRGPNLATGRYSRQWLTFCVFHSSLWSRTGPGCEAYAK